MNFLPDHSKYHLLEVQEHRSKLGLQFFVGIFSVVGVVSGLLFYSFGAKHIGSVSQVHESTQLAMQQVGGLIGGDVEYSFPSVPPPPVLPALVGELPDPEKFGAKSILVKDVETGMTLFEKNAYEVRPIASLTKMMSALVMLERDIDWATSTQVVADDLIDTHMYAGDTYTLEELWYASLVASSNKAIMTLSDAIGWNRPAFVDRMNQRATELGMGDTIFTEPTGLDQYNQSNASNLALLLDAALQQEKITNGLLTNEVSIYSAEREKKHHMWNTNWLLLGWIPNTFEAIVGGKTGYIPVAGYNYMMHVDVGEGRILSVVVLGADSHEARFTEARDIVHSVTKNYEWPGDDREVGESKVI